MVLSHLRHYPDDATNDPYYRQRCDRDPIQEVGLLHIHANHLAAFNAEALRIDPKWKEAKTTDDLGRMKESDFLDRIAVAPLSVIGKSVKKELKDCLDRRNGCGHPNSLKIGPNAVAHHIEILLLNVFQKF